MKALRGIVALLDETQELLCAKLTACFVTLALQSDESPRKPNPRGEDEDAADDESECTTPSEVLETQLAPLVSALLSLKWLGKALEAYREKAEAQLQEVVDRVASVCLGTP